MDRRLGPPPAPAAEWRLQQTAGPETFTTWPFPEKPLPVRSQSERVLRALPHPEREILALHMGASPLQGCSRGGHTPPTLLLALCFPRSRRMEKTASQVWAGGQRTVIFWLGVVLPHLSQLCSQAARPWPRPSL